MTRVIIWSGGITSPGFHPRSSSEKERHGQKYRKRLAQQQLLRGKKLDSPGIDLQSHRSCIFSNSQPGARHWMTFGAKGVQKHV